MGCRRGARIWFGAGGFQRGSAGGLGLWRVAIGPRWLAERTVADGVAGVLLAGAVRGFCELGHQVHLEIRPREGLGLANVIAENERASATRYIEQNPLQTSLVRRRRMGSDPALIAGCGETRLTPRFHLRRTCGRSRRFVLRVRLRRRLLLRRRGVCGGS